MSGPSPDTSGTDGREPGSDDPRLHVDRLRFALDVGCTGIWSWESGTQDFFGDRGTSLLWGLSSAPSLTNEIFLASLDPEDAEKTVEELRRAAGSTGPDHCLIEFRIRRAGDGATRWMLLQGRRYPAGSGSELIGVARDITSRKQRETHMHLLMREVTHRSKNLLAIIQAMARQTVKDSITAAEFEHRFSARLRGLAASHDLLAARDWHGALVGELVRWQLGPVLDTAGARISISGPDLYLNPEAAQNIGLAFNELASNAARFGALSGSDGRVEIVWSIDSTDAETRRFYISWKEFGGPEVAEPHRTGFGHKVVERLAARALDGEVNLAFLSTGLQWDLNIPASFVLDEADVPIVN